MARALSLAGARVYSMLSSKKQSGFYEARAPRRWIGERGFGGTREFMEGRAPAGRWIRPAPPQH